MGVDASGICRRRGRPIMNEPIDQPNRECFVSELEKNFSVVAAAGSGKTRAITDRIVQIAKSEQARDWLPHLVVVAFTNRAADEMQQRARADVLQAGVSVEVLAAFNRAFFGTIHAFCVRLLESYAANRAAVSKGIEARRTEMARHSRFCPVADLFFKGERFCSNQTRSIRARAALDRSGGALCGGGSPARLPRI